MPEPSNGQPSGNDSEPPLYAPESGFSLFFKLFIIPALIVAIALGIFLFGTLTLQHPKSAQQYLEELKSDSTSRRWQAAYELSRMLTPGEKIQFDEAFRAELVKTFAGSKDDDPRVREYLALVLGRLKEKSAIPALSEATHDPTKDVRLYSLWALGNIEDPVAGPAALAALSDPDSDVKVMAVGAMGALRYEPAKADLEGLLENPDPSLRYDSAVALARLKDAKALPVLLEMLTLKPTGQADKDEMVQSAKLSAIEAAQELPDPRLHSQIVTLSQEDPDIKVKEAALGALKK
jgi:HEAT repeat protein